jgi:DNA-binding winged helix-turn-helix (wHTH) protein
MLEYVGRVFKDRYYISKELGRGNIGVVYLAEDRQLHCKQVVIKVLLDTRSQNPWFRKKFNQEIEALSRVDHPGLVNVTDSGVTPDGKSFLVMQLVRGETLRAMIKQDGMDLELVATIVRQAGQAITAAHAEGIIHCDLKPENIMLQDLGEGEYQVKIVDFGVAKVQNSQVAALTTGTCPAGTPFYMAPEQYERKPCQASDIFALGVISYEMLTGRRPFDPATQYQVLESIRAGVRINPRDLRPAIPDPAQELILKALSYDPACRPQRARDFGEMLAEALSGSLDPSANVVTILERDVGRAHGLSANRSMSSTIEVFFEFGPFRVEPARRRLLRDGELIPLTARPFAVLLALVERPGRVVTAKELIDVVWQGDAVEENNLTVAVADVRRALGETQPHFKYIITHAGTGYQFIAEVSKKTIKPGEPDNEVPIDPRYYVVRSADREFDAAVARGDSIVLVNGGHQMGKTLLLGRGLQRAREIGAKVVVTDCRELGRAALESIDNFFLSIAKMVAEQLSLPLTARLDWDPDYSSTMNFSRFMRREVLANVNGRVVLALDEALRLFTNCFADEVLGLFSSWHSRRALEPEGPWGRMTLVFVYESRFTILGRLKTKWSKQTAFNIGTRITLEAFTLEQVRDLNQRYGSPLGREAEVSSFYARTRGHPSLTREALRMMKEDGSAAVIGGPGPQFGQVKARAAPSAMPRTIAGYVSLIKEIGERAMAVAFKDPLKRDTRLGFPVKPRIQRWFHAMIGRGRSARPATGVSRSVPRSEDILDWRVGVRLDGIQPSEGRQRFYIAGGTLPSHAPCYVSRDADGELLTALGQGQLCYVAGPRQTGKSSLMVRVAGKLRDEGRTVAIVDLSEIGRNATATQWYLGFLAIVGAQLGFEDECLGVWNAHNHLDAQQRWLAAMRFALDRCKGPTVLFLDDTDVVRSLPFATKDFLAGIRQVHNQRVEDSVTFCLLGTANPPDLFWCGAMPCDTSRCFELKDFIRSEAALLAPGLGDAAISSRWLEAILYWTGGHPYLTQRLCEAVAEDPTALQGVAGTPNPAVTVGSLCNDIFFSRAGLEIDDNLVFVRDELLEAERELAGVLGMYARVLRGRRVKDDPNDPRVSALKLAGITASEDGLLRARNRIYSQVFDLAWVGTCDPERRPHLLENLASLCRPWR